MHVIPYAIGASIPYMRFLCVNLRADLGYVIGSAGGMGAFENMVPSCM